MDEPLNFCTQCGARLKPGARFCGSCGAPTEAADSAPAQPQPYAPPSPPAQQPYYPPAPAQQQYTPPPAPVVRRPPVAPKEPARKTVSPLWSVGGLVLCIVGIIISAAAVFESDDASAAASGAGFVNLISLVMAARGMNSSLRVLSIIVLVINLLGLIAAAVLIFSGV